MFYVYALYNSQNDKIYIGTTTDLKRRIVEHNEKRGRHYTARYIGVWQLFYHERLPAKNAALKRERQLKSYRGRVEMRNMIDFSEKSEHVYI